MTQLSVHLILGKMIKLWKGNEGMSPRMCTLMHPQCARGSRLHNRKLLIRLDPYRYGETLMHSGTNFFLVFNSLQNDHFQDCCDVKGLQDDITSV